MRAGFDVNYLLHRQQISLIMAERARSAEGRAAYEGMARGYTDKLVAHRQENQRAGKAAR